MRMDIMRMTFLDQRLEAENLHVINLAQSLGQKFSNSGGILPNRAAREATENPKIVQAAVAAARCQQTLTDSDTLPLVIL